MCVCVCVYQIGYGLQPGGETALHTEMRALLLLLPLPLALPREERFVSDVVVVLFEDFITRPPHPQRHDMQTSPLESLDDLDVGMRACACDGVRRGRPCVCARACVRMFVCLSANVCVGVGVSVEDAPERAIL